ncbi:DUF3576 domain-containing protein [Yunchengibacter salinarum]|uniref:DUF3576 domain-containing protein n=1 Tax=Yunchengibacter salinarum TaxID=3133399 RepID=UPI0035B6AAF1
MTAILRAATIVILALSLQACGLFGGDDAKKGAFGPKTTAIGVNGYLWQATMDTLSFMPLDQADPAAATILTDWHSAPESPDERVKVTVRFLSEALRSDGIKVTVVRQTRKDGTWVSADVQARTPLSVEEAILTRARRLRIEAMEGKG